jgi:lactoylglutathione lyase
VSLTVTDLVRSIEWYTSVLGMRVLRTAENEHFMRAILSVDGFPPVFGLTRHDTGGGARFSELHAGLDHLSFDISDDDVADWDHRLTEQAIPFSKPRAGLIVLRDPDNIQIELFSS